MSRIIIDAGHGGRDLGATYNGRSEKDDNLRLALAVGKILENDGYDVVYTRNQDIYNSPAEKANIANALVGDFFVSFHRDSSVIPGQYDGVSVLVYDDKGLKAQTAKEITTNLESLGFKNVGVFERPELAVLRRTDMPAILIETGFINSNKDNVIFDNRFNEIANQIANAINDTVGISNGQVYYVQTGLYENDVYARRLAANLMNLGYPTQIGKYRGYTQVKVGPYYTLAEASATEKRLRNDGFSTLVIQQ